MGLQSDPAGTLFTFVDEHLLCLGQVPQLFFDSILPLNHSLHPAMLFWEGELSMQLFPGDDMIKYMCVEPSMHMCLFYELKGGLWEGGAFFPPFLTESL